MTKRELVNRVFHNEKADRVPVGFWFHFSENELVDVFKEPSMLDIDLNGLRKFYRDFKPDFVKIMTDGFFMYPNEAFANAERAADLWKVEPIGAAHPWIQKQIDFAKTVTGEFGSEVMMFYNIFAPVTLFRFAHAHTRENTAAFLADLIAEDAEAVRYALGKAASDMAALAAGVIKEGGADGIYYSAQDVPDPRVTGKTHAACIAPGDRAVLAAAADAGGLNILHVCGYAGHRNDLSHFVTYPAQVINWASTVEGVSLGEGKKLFGGRPVIGGFDNTTGGVLYRGSKAEIEEETERLLREAGTTGVALGADCTLPRGIDLSRLEWVRAKAAVFRGLA
ncbi:MAG: uroporphyrinogen decarboxylase [Treponema sp.]|jgi:uroporphyrinogen decarboxylase|nr:uroporphyrinogen decarboxylase [Treponema sp.]